MTYRMNTSSIELPDGWHEQTLHILTTSPPGKPGQSLVIISEPLPQGKDLVAYKELSLGRLPQQLPGFRLLKEEPWQIKPQRPGYLLEYVWQTDHGQMHVYQGVFVQLESKGFWREQLRGYSLTLTVPAMLHQGDEQELFGQIVQSQRFG